jgi:predicted RNase H-like HicB family nuclease
MVAQYLICAYTAVPNHFIVTLQYRGTIRGMRSIIQFNIWQEDGAYVAAAVNVPIATEGSTFDELQENIRDAVATYFEGDDPAALGFERLPTILTNYEVSPQAYAGRT